MEPTIIQIDDQSGRVTRWLYRVNAFAAAFPQYGTYEAIRKRIARRRDNGLLASGAVVETNLGNLVDANKFADWALQPREERGDA